MRGRTTTRARARCERRVGNTRALAVYERHGFARVGLRKNYYPNHLQREDAVVMSRRL